MEDFDLNIVASKSVKGMFALVSRTFLVQLLGIIANLVLTIYLSPENFGIFFVVSSIMVFLAYFQDIGLAASLIQKKEEPTEAEFRTTFTIQQGLVLLLVIPGLIFAGKISNFYNLGNEGLLLLYAFFISFFLSSLRTIPTVILERRLDFHKLVIPQIGENLIYNLCLIVFAILGFGITSFTIAVFFRGIVGLLLTYFVQPWRIGFAFDKNALSKLLSFGLPFQANSVLALVKDDLINAYIGKVLPLQQTGYIGFSEKWAYLPLRLVLDNVVKVIFPSFSRLQHDKNALRIFIEKALFMISLLMFPIAAGFITLSPHFISFIPRYSKWEPALLSMYFFSIDAALGALYIPLTNFLNAIGKVKVTLYFMVFLTILTWISTLLFIRFFGFNGVAFSSFVVSASGLVIIFFAKRYIEFSFTRSIFKQLIATLVMVVFILLTAGIIRSLPLLIIEILFASLLYFGIMVLLAKQEMLSAINLIVKNIRK